MSTTLPGTGVPVDTETVPVPPEEGGGTAERQKIHVADLNVAAKMMLEMLAYLVSAVDPTTGRLRIGIETNAVANQSTNLAQVAGAATAVGAGPTNTGSLRVTPATDVVPFYLMHAAWAQTIRPRIT
jgi:hypothetical protein